MKAVKIINTFVKKENKLLAVKRSENDKFFAGMWALPGGQMEKGETAFQTAQREVKEETNLNLTAIDTKPCLKGKLNVAGYPVIIFVHRAKTSGNKIIPHDFEIKMVGWITAQEFLNSLKKGNYPNSEIAKLNGFFLAEGLI